MRAVGIHFDKTHRHYPSAVICFALVENALLWVRHPERGWELPGGKVEPGETPEEAMFRELYEEAGVTRAVGLIWVGEYGVEINSLIQYKWIYTCTAVTVATRPSTSEITDVSLFQPIPAPDDVRCREDFSYIVQDDMYGAVCDQLALSR